MIICKGGDDERSCSHCTFEETSNPPCGWSDFSQDTILWRRGFNGTLLDVVLGPIFDGNSYRFNGNYICLPKENNIVSDAPVRFDVPIFRKASTTCLFELWSCLPCTSPARTSHPATTSLPIADQLDEGEHQDRSRFTAHADLQMGGVLRHENPALPPSTDRRGHIMISS